MALKPSFAWTYKVVVLTCLVFVAPSRQETPQYSYACQEDGKVVLHGFSANAYITIIHANGSQTSDCPNKTFKSDAFGHITINCSEGNAITDDRHFTFQAVDTPIDGSTTVKQVTPAPSKIFSMGQRFHKYFITCKVISMGVVDHVIGHVGVQDIAPLPNVYNSVGSIEMRFKSEEAKTNSTLNLLPDISSVYIGDKFYMYLKYMGSQAYTISPQTCTAYGGNTRAVVQDDDKKAELWNYASCATKTSTDYHLMKNFLKCENSQGKIVYAEMYGFNFITNGDITIECDVKICRDTTHSNCFLHENSTCPKDSKWKARKRRSSEGDHTKVYGTLKVLNNNNSNSVDSQYEVMFVLTTTIQTLLCLMFLGISRQETPQYSYECQEDGTVVLHGFSKDSYIKITNTNVTYCANKGFTSDSKGHVTINCSKGNIAKDRSFTFQAVDSLVDAKTTTTVAPTAATTAGTTAAPTAGSTATQTAETTAGSTAGSTAAPTVRKRRRDVLSMGQSFHNYVITCKMISKGVVDHVIGHVGVQNIAPLPNVFNSVGSIEMRFKSEEAKVNSAPELLPDISSVYIGDKFYMYLKYMGSQDYTISPQACTAYGGDKRSVVQDASPKAVLWKYDTCATDTSIDYHLMHNFLKVSGKIVYAEMFGFNFVDNGDITIECDVKICRDTSHPECVFKQSPSTTCPPESNWLVRKRRSPTGDNTKVYGTLKVLNRNNSNSAGINHVNWMCLVLVQLVFLWKRE